MKKLKNDRGETLVEVLASVLISALSVTLLFSAVMVSSRIDVNAKEADSGYYANFTNAEVQIGTPFSTVTVKVEQADPDDINTAPKATVAPEKAPSVNIYGSDGIYSYKRK